MTRSLVVPRRFLAVALFALLAAVFVMPARAESDAVQFFNSINVEQDTAIHDAVCFFCNVNVKGTVKGDIVVFFGNARIDGEANHDIVVFFGSVRAADNTTIGHDVVNFFGNVRLGENASIGKDTVVMFGNLQMASSASIGGNRVIQPGWVFWGPFLLIAFVIIIAVRELRGSQRRRYLRGY